MIGKNRFVRKYETINCKVFSCSNDTTIKLWSLAGIGEAYSSGKGRSEDAKTFRSRYTFNEDYDYVRGMAYSSYGNVLFSAADNGIVRKWDIQSG